MREDYPPQVLNVYRRRTRIEVGERDNHSYSLKISRYENGGVWRLKLATHRRKLVNAKVLSPVFLEK